MSAIEVRPEKVYSYTGYVRSYRRKSWCPEIMDVVCRDYKDDAAPPVMLEAKDEIKQYLEELMGCQFEESRMRMTFHFNEWCELHAIDVLDAGGEVVKQIKHGAEWRPFIGEVGAVIGPWAGPAEETEAAGEH